MQSQIAFVPSRPQLVSVAEFDDEPICLFAGIEIVIGAAFLRCPGFKLTRFYRPMSPFAAMGKRIAFVKTKSAEWGWPRNALTNQGTAFFG